ncbi:MAG TPA: rod shape-determining protein [Thermoanaerobaculia bacterium]|jgi:rod shape-determining protein MreB|nr:rod shape-determining protein [Thermoanaerobaculia bacterium]
MSGKKDVLHVGIDLGTSRSSISASTGTKHVVDSYVGWPVDMVAKKVVKKAILFGREALENRPMLDLHRPLERGLIKEGSPKDEEAVRELLRHLIGLGGGSEGRKVNAVVGVPAEALRVSRAHLRAAVKGVADSLMIVSEPFAVAYGMEALLHTMVIDIGAGTSDFCVMKGRYPTEEDQRTLTNAGDSVDEQLAMLVRARHPEAKFTIHMVREWKEKMSFVGEAKGPVSVTVPVAGKPTPIDITSEMKRACESLLGPIIETMLDLLSRVDPEYQERVRQNIVLAGGGSQIPGLAASLEKALGDVGGGRVRAVEDPIFAGSTGGLAIALDAPDGDWEQLPG